MAADDTGPNVNIAWRIWVGTIATLVPATISVVLRFIARYVARAGYWWDDWTILVALVRPASCLYLYVIIMVRG